MEPRPRLFLAIDPDSATNFVPLPTMILPSATESSEISSRLES